MNSEKTETDQSKVTIEEVYRSTYPTIFRTVMKKYANGDYDLARDYCQIGFIRVSANLHKYSGKGNLEGWVKRVVNNAILTEIRRRKLETVNDWDFERTDTEDVPYSEEWMGGTITTEDIMRVIQELPKTYRNALILFYFEKKSFKEIEKITGTEQATQRAYLFRARNILKEKLGKIIDRRIKI